MLHNEYGAGLVLEFIEEDRRVGGQANNQFAVLGPFSNACVNARMANG